MQLLLYIPALSLNEESEFYLSDNFKKSEEGNRKDIKKELYPALTKVLLAYYNKKEYPLPESCTIKWLLDHIIKPHQWLIRKDFNPVLQPININQYL